MTEQQTNEAAAVVLNAALETCAAMYDADGRVDVAYAVRKGIQ